MSGTADLTTKRALVGGVEPIAFIDLVERHMLDLLDAQTGSVARAARDQVSAGGKRLRPLLVRAARPRAMEAADDDTRAAFDSASVHAAAAVELLHTASLVHDDLLDGAQLRRGVPTVDATLGRAAAVAAGDLLFSLAFATLVNARTVTDAAVVHRATRELARTARALAHGEALQARQVRNTQLTEAAYFERCAGKTGVLFGASLQLGALFGGASDVDVEALRQFGADIGTAFQLTDDVLDCGAPDSEALLGKAPGADVRDGTITLPMLHAIAADPSLATVLAQPVADGDVAAVVERIRATGGLETARIRAFELRDAAQDRLGDLQSRFDITPLLEIARRSVDRLT